MAKTTKTNANKDTATTTKVNTPTQDENAVLKAKIAEQERRMADMMAQMEAMMSKTAVATQPVVAIPTKSRNIKFINMTTGGLSLKGNRFYHMDKQFDSKMIPESEARAIVSNMPNAVTNGMVYIADADFVREMELDGMYEDMLSDKQLKALLGMNANEVCDIYSTASDAQKQIIVDMVADRKMNGMPVDANIVVQLGKLCGKDLIGIEPDEE